MQEVVDVALISSFHFGSRKTVAQKASTVPCNGCTQWRVRDIFRPNDDDDDDDDDGDEADDHGYGIDAVDYDDHDDSLEIL
ncbi:hypothetical protein ElyMa_001809500 [Elysia marginata]|uniref:Uncharacterized protein n=1 Tax=Elysia marginata TaxID=1093978 RepID=A0AAV4EHI6_9GAST|nr:hypothetical protein ElyMa_001809500 [Elysia marginata]